MLWCNIVLCPHLFPIYMIPKEQGKSLIVEAMTYLEAPWGAPKYISTWLFIGYPREVPVNFLKRWLTWLILSSEWNGIGFGFISYTSICVTSNPHIHISYFVSTRKHVFYAYTRSLHLKPNATCIKILISCHMTHASIKCSPMALKPITISSFLATHMNHS